MSSSPQTPERPVKVPEARYECAGEYCPEPGHKHPANRLYLHPEMNRPGFFCPVCRPTPFPVIAAGDLPEKITLEQYLLQQTKPDNSGNEGQPGKGTLQPNMF